MLNGFAHALPQFHDNGGEGSQKKIHNVKKPFDLISMTDPTDLTFVAAWRGWPWQGLYLLHYIPFLCPNFGNATMQPCQHEVQDRTSTGSVLQVSSVVSQQHCNMVVWPVHHD